MPDMQDGNRIKRAGAPIIMDAIAAPDAAASGVAGALRYARPEELDRELAAMDLGAAIAGQMPSPPPSDDWVYRWVSQSQRVGNDARLVTVRSQGWRVVPYAELAEWAALYGIEPCEDGSIRYRTLVLHKTTHRQANILKATIRRQIDGDTKAMNQSSSGDSSGRYTLNDNSYERRVRIGDGE